MSRPLAKMPIRSQTVWTWLRRWLDSMIARPRSSTSRRSRSRISTTPIGSIDVVGSSRMSRSGDLTRASAMPSRWRMPREYAPTGSSAATRQPDLLEDLVDGGGGLAAVEAVEPRRVAQVLATRHALVEADRIGQVADPTLDLARLPGRVQTHDRGLAVGRLGQAEEHQDGRGLARAVLAEQAEDLARVDLQVQAVDGRERAVSLGQLARPDDRLGPLVAGVGGGCGRGWRGVEGWSLDAAHRRPNRRNVSHSPTSTMTIRPIPTAPQSRDVSIVTRTSAEALASGAVALNEAT